MLGFPNLQFQMEFTVGLCNCHPWLPGKAEWNEGTSSSGDIFCRWLRKFPHLLKGRIRDDKRNKKGLCDWSQRPFLFKRFL